MELHLLDAQLTRQKVEVLGPVGAASAPVRVVPAGCWQAVRCTDFRLMRDVPETAAQLAQAFPELSAFL